MEKDELSAVDKLKFILGKRIKESREKAKLTQPDLAKMVGSTDRNISNYETGYSYPSVKVLYHISIALETSADYLLGLTDQASMPSKSSEVVNLDDERILHELKNDEEMYRHLSSDPETEIHYLYKFRRLLSEWESENN